jgi:hypothetical protein
MISHEEMLKLVVQAGGKVWKNGEVTICDDSVSGSGTNFVEVFSALCYEAGQNSQQPKE